MSDDGPKFTWGDSARVGVDAPNEYEPGELCAVVGLSALVTEERIQKFGLPFGSIVYTVEFMDGHSIEIPEMYLELILE